VALVKTARDQERARGQSARARRPSSAHARSVGDPTPPL
jgi:hypothetical protein